MKIKIISIFVLINVFLNYETKAQYTTLPSVTVESILNYIDLTGVTVTGYTANQPMSDWDVQYSIWLINQYYNNNNNGNPNTGGCDNAGGHLDQCANCVAVGGTDCTPTPPTECGGPGSTWSQECGMCIGGNTGIAACPPLCNNPVYSGETITLVPPSATSITSLGVDWGYTEDESIDIDIDVCLNNTTNKWEVICTKIVGHYSQQVRLVSGCYEITGIGGNTSSANFCTQAHALKTLGNGNSSCYMIAAVRNHEDVHVTRLLPALTNVRSQIESAVETIIINNTGQTAAQAKASALALLQPRIAITGNIRSIWDAQYVLLIANDHSPNGPADTAERLITEPMRTAICTHASSSGWGPCTHCF
jgi:hypothetical protein